MGPPTQSSISGKRACYGCVNGGMPGPRKQSSHIVSSRLRLSQLRWQTYGRMRARRWGQWRSKAKGRAKRGNGSTGHAAVGAARRPDTVLRMTLPSSWHVCGPTPTARLLTSCLRVSPCRPLSRCDVTYQSRQAVGIYRLPSTLTTVLEGFLLRQGTTSTLDGGRIKGARQVPNDA